MSEDNPNHDSLPGKTKPGLEPAYPIETSEVKFNEPGITVGPTICKTKHLGMSIRQKACIAAMNGAIASKGVSVWKPEAIAKYVVECADAVLAEEERTR